MQTTLHRGYTLTELLIVLAIIGAATAVALPSMTTSDYPEFDRRVAQFANAMRFARDEALRTRRPHGFRYLSTQERIRVFSADTATTPFGQTWDVYHPVDKQLYDVTFPVTGSDPDPVSRNAVFRASCSTPGIVYFDANGIPWCNDPDSVLVDYFELLFTAGNREATVRLDGVTGRVVVQ